MDGCKNYKVLNGIDRAQGYTFPAQQRCDSGLEQRWYRFQGLAGDQMADTCVPMLRCGTVASGWLSGPHPTVADGVVLRKVCYNWLACCGYSDDIQVRNCGGFFVYELKKPPSCNLRYCGNGSAGKLLCCVDDKHFWFALWNLHEIEKKIKQNSKQGKSFFPTF